MARKRKTATPVTEQDAFTDELAPATELRLETQDDFFRGTARDLQRVRSKASGRPVATVSFASVSALLTVLTPKRYALIEAVKRHGRFESIEALAHALGRGRAIVSRDLRALAEAGLVQVPEAVLRGPWPALRNRSDGAAPEARVDDLTNHQ